MASGVCYDRCSDGKNPTGYAIPGNSVFVSRKREVNGKIVPGRVNGEAYKVPLATMLAAANLVLQRAIQSERQSANWGVRGSERLLVAYVVYYLQVLRCVTGCYNFVRLCLFCEHG